MMDKSYEHAISNFSRHSFWIIPVKIHAVFMAHLHFITFVHISLVKKD